MHQTSLPSYFLHPQLSIKYDADLEDLSITLNQVKGQSLGDMFINTYLIPDNRYVHVTINLMQDMSIKGHNTAFGNSHHRN